MLRPALTGYCSVYGRLRHPEEASNRQLASAAGGVGSAHRSHRVRGEFCVAVECALDRNVAPALHAVGHVLFDRPKPQVVRVHARGVVAVVEHTQPVGDWAPQQSPCGSMCERGVAGAHGESSVCPHARRRVAQTRHPCRPQPAAAHWLWRPLLIEALNLRPATAFRWFGSDVDALGHGLSLHRSGRPKQEEHPCLSS